MWRSNVPRLRKRSSAVLWHTARPKSSLSGLPITDVEFREALRSVGGLEPFDGHSPHRRRPLGFAISGGVDSMALASLFAQSNELSKLKETKSAGRGVRNAGDHAFIVDHKARPESTEEAEWVAEQCRTQFGLKATVLPLTWPADSHTLDHKRFETIARTLRYQALGRACRAEGIVDLLVAHHADDQAETVLMRLANNRLRSGLQAMQPIEWIPECHGIYGVSHSGASPECRSYDELWQELDNRTGKHSILACRSIPVERGGVRLLRPLLDFEKSRLIATCEQHGVTWAEDKTNKMQTYTARNAIRHILKNHELPAALDIQSLVDTASHMRRRVNMYKYRAHDLLHQCRKQLDPQTGSLLIQFPPFSKLLGNTEEFPRKFWLDPKAKTSIDWNTAKNTAICLLAEAGQMVSPKERLQLGELASTIANIWQEFLLEDCSFGVGHSKTTESYCVHGIWWRKSDRPMNESCRNEAYHRELRQWLLARQPLENYRATATSETIQYPPSYGTNAIPTPAYSRDDYQLFDGRWWIRVENHSSDVLILRHFTKEDLGRISSPQVAKRGISDQYIPAALSMVKPADLRFTLPALFRRDSATQEEILIGFPTLDVSTKRLGYPKDICSWQVHYKKLEYETCSRPDTKNMPLGYRRSSDVGHEQIRKQLAKYSKTQRSQPPGPSITPHSFSEPSRLLDMGQDTSASQSNPKTRRPVGATSDNRKSKGAIVHDDAASPGFSGKSTKRMRAIPLVPTAESKRRGRSEKREGGGYDIKWEDFGNRFN